MINRPRSHGVIRPTPGGTTSKRIWVGLALVLGLALLFTLVPVPTTTAMPAALTNEGIVKS